MILETDQGGRVQLDVIVGVDHHVADESSLAGFCPDVDEADAWEALALGGLVVMAEELIAAAHRQHDCAVFDRSF